MPQSAAGCDFGFHVTRFHPPQYRRFQTAEAEVEGIAFHLGKGEPDRGRIAVGREAVDDRTAGVAETEQLSDLVEGLAGGIVAGLTKRAICEIFADFEQ